MTDLLTRVAATLDHIEQLALAATAQDKEEGEGTGWWWDSPETPREEHIAHWTPRAALDIVAGHREILAWCERANQLLPGAPGARHVLYLIAKAHRIEV